MIRSSTLQGERHLNCHRTNPSRCPSGTHEGRCPRRKGMSSQKCKYRRSQDSTNRQAVQQVPPACFPPTSLFKYEHGRQYSRTTTNSSLPPSEGINLIYKQPAATPRIQIESSAKRYIRWSGIDCAETPPPPPPHLILDAPIFTSRQAQTETKL